MLATTWLKPSGSSLLSPQVALSSGGARARSRNELLKMVTPRLGGSRGVIRAAISSGGGKTTESNKGAEPDTNGPVAPHFASHNAVTPSGYSGGIDVKVLISIKSKTDKDHSLTDKIGEQLKMFLNGLGQRISIQLISKEIDPDTQSGRRVEANVYLLPKVSSADENGFEYAADFTVPKDFGQPGAVLISNHQSKEFYLVSIAVYGFDSDPISFLANSWIHARTDNHENRIIFRNEAYLPSQTPAGVRHLRHEDLLSIRGNGRGERRVYDRIYDYAPYNDLGNPDKDVSLARPVLGGDDRPYPRRCRTGRPPTISDPTSERREKHDLFYIPRDEISKEAKQSSSSIGAVREVLDKLVPSITAKLSDSDIALKKAISGISEASVNVEAPIPEDAFAWLRDHEFARQTLAGTNPVNIEILKDFPIISKLDPEVYGPQESALTKEHVGEQIHGMSIDQALVENRLFIVDHHDLLLPYIGKMNTLPGKKSYSPRTIFFYTETGTLMPIAIELSLPGEKTVYTHGHDATSDWKWKLAKAHVSSNDAAVHQYVNHWLRTHATMEAYIIATHRQLSSIHPIHKLLHPHMRYTLETNANARQNLLPGGGVVEASFSTGDYGMEISSVAYKSAWRFDMEGLPADLLRRGMAVEDPSACSGVKLVIEDYPYAADGLLLWSAIKEWVEFYVNHYYTEPDAVKSDVELQDWWYEIKNKAHADKRDEPWWPKLNTKEDLSSILTTIMWVASCQHAAMSLGQIPSAGIVPKRPTFMRKLIPREGDSDYENFFAHPHFSFLSSMPPQAPASKAKAGQNRSAPPDEDFLGGLDPLNYWVSDPKVTDSFKKFVLKLEEIKEIINTRNKNPKLKNRTGAGVPPYEALLPKLGPGVADRGIPNSASA